MRLLNSLCAALALTAALSPAATAAEGASFDCAKAASPLEKTICANPSLSALDGRLAAAYKGVLDQLSDEGRTEFRNGQRRWLKSLRAICDPGRPPTEAGAPVPCLEFQFTEQIAELGKALTLAGGTRILRVQMKTDIRCEDEEVCRRLGDRDKPFRPTILTAVEAYPRIEPAATEADRQWNAWIKGLIHIEGPPPDPDTAFSDTDYEILTLTAGIISVKIKSRMHALAGAGAFNTAIHHWLRPEGRELTAAGDLFNGEEWRRILAQAVAGRKGAADDAFDVEDLEHWRFRREGLVILLDPDDDQDGAVKKRQVTIPWPKLKPSLRIPSLMEG